MTGIVESVKKTLSLKRRNKEDKAVDNAVNATQADSSEPGDVDIDENTYDQYQDADDEALYYLHKSVMQGESTGQTPSGTLLHRLIVMGNKKTEQQIAREQQEEQEQERQRQRQLGQQAPTVSA